MYKPCCVSFIHVDEKALFSFHMTCMVNQLFSVLNSLFDIQIVSFVGYALCTSNVFVHASTPCFLVHVENGALHYGSILFVQSILTQGANQLGVLHGSSHKIDSFIMCHVGQLSMFWQRNIYRKSCDYITFQLALYLIKIPNLDLAFGEVYKKV